ncbi:MAG: hypothetical protein H6858_01615 [Rhodospirillales bacterium]|nr:hypothetical protein [Alphaproteobacteria bacterium]MCB1839377.1 hypothetical protein [Alphaproteobacteria bacterium]MCB9976280.1 hypothetical protein [Rhodospirillales bacterium]
MKPNECVKVLELMASKVCHDLISPIGAVSNGIEFLEEAGEAMDAEAVKLIAFSAEQASVKLKVFRLAYGAGGSDASIKPEDVHKAFGDYVAGDGRIEQDWDPFAPLGLSEPPTGFCKILMCLLLALIDTLPKGGTVCVFDGGDGSTHLKSEGENAGFREGYRDALFGTAKPGNLEPKTIHPYLTHLLLSHYGYSIHVLESPAGSILLSLRAA